ncbi:cell surface protein [Pediococcus ethanolidurans]|nr:cell surface protein [Pediococcus ethanolidurans]SER07910.1 protein of unknown function [Pediococcus ethanolidurans]
MSGVSVTKAAGTSDVQAVPIGVTPVVNKNQISKGVSYYDLKLGAGKSTDLKLKISNISSKAVTVKLKATTAITNSNAVIDYGKIPKTVDSSMRYRLDKLIKIAPADRKITIPSKRAVLVTARLTMPDKKLNGTLLGALHVEPVTKKVKKGLQSKYAFAVACMVTNGKQVKPDLKLNTVKAGVRLGQRVVTVNVQNYRASLLTKGHINTTITRQGQNRVLKHLVVQTAAFAPNTNFNLPVPWGSSAIAPGNYTLHMTYTSTDGQFAHKKTWKFNKDFHISAVQAARYNLGTLQIPWWIYVIIAFVVILLIVLIWLLLKRRKKEDKADDSK